MARPTVLVVGGGVSGLTTAYRLARLPAGSRPHVVVAESSDRLGGKILTRDVAGHRVDTGPDAVLVRLPAMARLLDDLGLSDDLVAPSPVGAYVWSRGRLRRLPDVNASGLPRGIRPVVGSGLLSPVGLARAGLDLVLPRRGLPADPSVGELVRPRLGGEVFERLVEPMLGGLHAGRADLLSARSAAPDLWSLAQRSRSLALGVRRSPTPDADAGPPLVSVRGGLGRLVDALFQGLPDDVDVLTGHGAVGLTPTATGFVAELADHDRVPADAVVLATPAPAAAALLEPWAPGAAASLRDIPYADVASVTLAYPRDALAGPLDATGFLVPPEEGRLLVGASWLSAKWPYLADDDVVLLRGLVGRYGDRRAGALPDDALAEAVHDELVAAMRLRQPPTAAVVQRWPGAMPQYTVGHQARLDAAAAALVGFPGVHLTGAAYRGIGIASCVAQAERTAAAVVAALDGAAAPAGGPR